MLELIGEKDGMPVSLVWNDGELIGTQWAIREFRDFVGAHEGVVAMPSHSLGGPYRKTGHIQRPYAIIVLARKWFDEGVQITGDIPCSGNVLPGAII